MLALRKVLAADMAGRQFEPAAPGREAEGMVVDALLGPALMLVDPALAEDDT